MRASGMSDTWIFFHQSTGEPTFFYHNLQSGKVLVVPDNSTNALRLGAKGFRFTSIGLNLINFVVSLPSLDNQFVRNCFD